MNYGLTYGDICKAAQPINLDNYYSGLYAPIQSLGLQGNRSMANDLIEYVRGEIAGNVMEYTVKQGVKAWCIKMGILSAQLIAKFVGSVFGILLEIFDASPAY